MNSILFYNSFAFRVYSFKREVHNDNSQGLPHRFFGRLREGSGRLVSKDKTITQRFPGLELRQQRLASKLGEMKPYMKDRPAYAREHWDVMTTWADYLCEYGLDPENQLCTDDFAGHLAHNCNLSLKAIMGIAGYSRILSKKMPIINLP